MKRNSFQRLAAALAWIGMIVPQTAFAVSPVVQANDVAIRPGGLVVGQVVDAQGVAQAATVVSIQQDQQEVVRTTTDQNGVFAAQGLRGGQYLIVTEQGQGLYRLWAPNTAPPSAQQTAVVVTSPDVMRGQYGGGWINWMSSHPFITAGIIAAAVAIPVAIAADDDNNS